MLSVDFYEVYNNTINNDKHIKIGDILYYVECDFNKISVGELKVYNFNSQAVYDKDNVCYDLKSLYKNFNDAVDAKQAVEAFMVNKNVDGCFSLGRLMPPIPDNSPMRGRNPKKSSCKFGRWIWSHSE